MIEIICKNCRKRWHIFDEDWKEVESCPFCSVIIEKTYEIEINSFEDALKQIFLKQGLEILLKKRNLIAFFMDIYSQYKSEIKIVSNYCTEEMLEKIYANRDDSSALGREIKIIKTDMISNGISETWAENIGESFFNAVSGINDSIVYLPESFRIVEEVEIENIEEYPKLSDASDRKIEIIAYQFIIEDKIIYESGNSYSENTVGRLMKELKISFTEKVFYIHDDTYFNDGTYGYIITEKGIYNRDIHGLRYTTWKEFLTGEIEGKNRYSLLLNNKIFVSHVRKENQEYIIDTFFYELQKYIRQNMNIS